VKMAVVTNPLFHKSINYPIFFGVIYVNFHNLY